MIDSPKAIKILIDAGFDIDTRDLAGYTPLMKTNSQEVAQLLIDAGADVNATCISPTPAQQNTDTVLMITESPDIVRLLVKAGANIDAQNIMGDTALMNTESLEKIIALINCGADPYIENQFGWNAFNMIREYCTDHDAIEYYLKEIEPRYAPKLSASATKNELGNVQKQINACIEKGLLIQAPKPALTNDSFTDNQ
ncbi:MAG: hypothetical protein B7Y48_03975 [Methylophilales bacterium 28-44-11]|nr:MAG: hypothetical protein B7Y48_03975 [Methylophilales bacterium 28-44-11]